jgi:hypothetical protein
MTFVTFLPAALFLRTDAGDGLGLDNPSLEGGLELFVLF